MLLTYRYRVKDATAGKRLARMAVSVNQVWNYCGGIQNDSRRLNRRWPSGFDLSVLHDRDTNAALNILASGRNVALHRPEIPAL